MMKTFKRWWYERHHDDLTHPETIARDAYNAATDAALKDRERMKELLKDALSVLQDPVSQSVAYGTESFKSERTSELRGIIRALLAELEAK